MHESVDPRLLKIDMRELAARLNAPTTSLGECEQELYELLIASAKPMYVTKKVNVSSQNGSLFIGNSKIESNALLEVCKNCEECILLAATLGVSVDRLILRTATASMYDAFVIDAMADALIEALCDFAESKCTDGLLTSARFSPGYADLDLSFGKEILLMTDAERKLGIKQSESGLMLPKKSVNAIIAIKKQVEQ